MKKTTPNLRLYLVLAGVAAAFTAVVIVYSRLHGNLAVLPTGDDAFYFQDAAYRLLELKNHGLLAFFKQCVEDFPHNPFSTFLAFFTFSFAGFHATAAYAANALVVFLLLVGASQFLKKYPRWLKVLLYVMILLMPMTWRLVDEFRSEGALSIELALGALLIARGEGGIKVGLCFGVALLTKPTAFPYTIGFYGLARTLSFATKIRKDYSFLKKEIPLTLLIAAPYYLLGWRATWDYMYMYMFTSQSDLWDQHLIVREWLLYYLTGYGSRQRLGFLFYLFSAIIVFGEGLVLWRKSKSKETVGMQVFTGLTLVSWQVISTSSSRIPLFGMPFFMMLFFAALWHLEFFWIHVGSRLGQKKTFFAILASVAVLLGVASAPHSTNEPHAQEFLDPRMENEMVNAIFNAIEAQPFMKKLDWDNAASAYITVAGIPRVPRMQWCAFKRGTPVYFMSKIFNSDPATILSHIKDADFVIASSSKAAGVLRFLTNAKIADQVLELLKKSSAFKQVAAFPDGKGESYFLFVRTKRK